MNWQDKKITAMAFRCRADSILGFEDVDEGSRRVTGYASTDLVEAGQVNLPDLVLEKERDHVRQQVQDGLNRQGSFAVQFSLITKDKLVIEAILIGKGIFSTPLMITGIEGYIIRMQE